MLDLWKIKRVVGQRSKRNTSEKSALMYEAFNRIIEKPTVKNAEAFVRLENHFLKYHPRNRERYGNLVLDAIRGKYFVINRPPIHGFGINEVNPRKGYVYIASSQDRQGQLKIGYTTMDPYDRCVKFKSKYCYRSFSLSGWIYCDDPVRFEMEIQSEFKDRLVSGMVTNDSREWYYLKRDEFLQSTESLSETLGLRIYRRSW